MKQVGALSAGNSAAGYAIAFGGAITINTPTLVEHVFTASIGTFTLFVAGTLNVDYDISGTGSFDGHSTDGSTAVTGATSPVPVFVTTGSVTVSYNPTTDWTP